MSLALFVLTLRRNRRRKIAAEHVKGTRSIRRRCYVEKQRNKKSSSARDAELSDVLRSPRRNKQRAMEERSGIRSV